MKKYFIIGSIIFIVILIGLSINLKLFDKMSGKKSSQITSTTIKKDNSEDLVIEAFGIVKTENSYNVNIDFTATVEKFYVKEGQKVKKGDRLALIKYDDYESLIKSKELELLNTQYELKKLSAESYLEDSANYQIQKKKVEILMNEINRMNSHISEKNIINNNLYSNISNGIITDIGYNDGDFILKEKKLLSILDIDNMIIEADVPEEFIKDVKIGNTVKIIPVSNKTRNYKGKIKRISGIASNKNGETVIKIYISIDNKDDFLLPNYNVDIKIYY